MCTGTLGGAAGIGAGIASRVDGGTVMAYWLAWSKLWANCGISWIWASPIWAKGDGLGLASVSARARAALTVASAEEFLGTGQSWGRIQHC